MYLYHSGRGLAVGDILRPYSVGFHDKFGPLVPVVRECLAKHECVPGLLTLIRHQPSWGTLLNEIVFDVTRQELGSTAPSRFECCFLLETVKAAIRYRTRFMQHGNLIYRCRILEGEPTERDMDLITWAIPTPDPHEVVRGLRSRAARYWLGQGDMTTPELVVKGRVIVDAVVC